MKRKLPGDYIAGFVDGEGHFGLRLNLEVKMNRKGQPSYWRWALDFAISLSEEDELILKMIKDTLECGIINTQYGRTLQYRVYNFNDICNKIVPFFGKYPLRAKKKQDFILWKEAAGILKRYKRNSLFERITIKPNDEKRLKKILEELHRLHGVTNKGLPKGRPRMRGILK